MKSVIGVALAVGNTAVLDRGWMYVLLAAVGVGPAVTHGWWLPRNGINGWTADPRERYFELIALNSAGKPRDGTHSIVIRMKKS